jgi:hypothetical protein
VAAARSSDSIPQCQDEATILTFPLVSDADAFDHESRETMGRWKWQARHAGYFFQADAVTGDWVMATLAGSQWAAIERHCHVNFGRTA